MHVRAVFPRCLCQVIRVENDGQGQTLQLLNARACFSVFRWFNSAQPSA
jgi:hypothetical protein